MEPGIHLIFLFAQVFIPLDVCLQYLCGTYAGGPIQDSSKKHKKGKNFTFGTKSGLIWCFPSCYFHENAKNALNLGPYWTPIIYDILQEARVGILLNKGSRHKVWSIIPSNNSASVHRPETLFTCI